ncbi:MAG TPA: hypothetical protein DC054_23745 [Blastocatellia bacterium]|nr:hypothetical protein [Blastocatellia bacterium]
MRLVTFGLALICLLGVTQAQSDSDELIKIKESVKENVGKQMHGWTYRSIEPIQGSGSIPQRKIHSKRERPPTR